MMISFGRRSQAVFQTAADPNGSRGLNLSATSPYLSDIFVIAPHHTIETESLKVFCCFFAEGEIGGTLCMRSHISVHGATTKFCDNPFVFKNAIEKEGLPGDITPALGAGGRGFESRQFQVMSDRNPPIAHFMAQLWAIDMGFIPQSKASASRQRRPLLSIKLDRKSVV